MSHSGRTPNGYVPLVTTQHVRFVEMLMESVLIPMTDAVRFVFYKRENQMALCETIIALQRSLFHDCIDEMYAALHQRRGMEVGNRLLKIRKELLRLGTLVVGLPPDTQGLLKRARRQQNNWMLAAVAEFTAHAGRTVPVLPARITESEKGGEPLLAK